MTDRPFHIAVNARMLLAGRIEGLGRYADEVLSRVVRHHPEARFSFVFDRAYDDRFLYAGNVTPHVVPPPTRHPVLTRAWTDVMVPRLLRRIRPDVYFSPDGFLCSSSPCPQVAVIHDLSFVHHPEDMKPVHARYYRRRTPGYARQAVEVMTSSNYSKDDIVRTYGIDRAKITVTGCAAGAHFHPTGEAEQAAIRERFTGGRPFFHYHGALQPRKNIVTVIKAFERFRAATGADVDLVLVGRKAWKFEDIVQAAENSPVTTSIHFTGFVDDETLSGLNAASLGLVYIPWFEGFGIPVVEAMQCGCPVITSSRTSLPEVAGSAAVVVEPDDTDAVTEAMTRLHGDPALARRLTEAGLERAREYDWDRFAESTWQVLTRAALAEQR